MKDFDGVFFNRFLKWAVLITIALAYYITYKQPASEMVNKKLDEIKEEQKNAPSDVIVPEVSIIEEDEDPQTGEAADKSIVNGVLQNVINKVSQTEKGRVVIRSLTEHAADKMNEEDKLLYQTIADDKKIQVSDVTRGFGKRVGCHSKVTYDYRAYLPGKIKFETSYLPEHVPVTIFMGKNQVIPGLELGLLGMQEGARRKISIPPPLAFEAPGFQNSLVSESKIVLYDVEVRKVEEGLEPLPAHVAAYNLKILGKGNRSNFVECGEFVTLDYHIISTQPATEEEQGKANSKRVTLKVGDGSLPYGLDEAMVGLYEGGQYEIELPEYWQQIHNPESPMKKELDALKERMLNIHFQIISIDR